MSEDMIYNYIKNKGSASIPEMQNEFGLSYKVLRKYVETLQNKGQVVLKDGLDFVPNKCDQGKSVIREKRISFYNDIEYAQVLKFCIEKGKVRPSMIRENFEDINLVEAMHWMYDNGYIENSEEGLVLTIDMDEFKKRFGDLGWF